jgi:CheY-like chemotaxis protein
VRAGQIDRAAVGKLPYCQSEFCRSLAKVVATSRFRVVTPGKVAVMNRPHPDAQPLLDLENVRLLVVESEPETQAMIVSTLQACGANVVAANSVQSGLAAIDQQRPDVLISDLFLPDGDGCSLMRAVRQREAIDHKQAVPAIAVSSSARAVDLDQVVSAGFKRYLSKPIQSARLINLVGWLTNRIDIN